MIKVHIDCLEGACDIELKKDQESYHLVAILSTSGFLKEKGKAWYAKTSKEDSILEIRDLVHASYQNPSLPGRISINDGIQIAFSLTENEQEIKLVCKDVEEGTREFQLIQKLMALVRDLVKDPVLNNYTNIVENYISH